MKTCLLNLPYPMRIMRRYNCTYYAPNFLFPPLELMYLSAIIKKWKKDDCILIDAIAEGLSFKKVITLIKSYQPDLLVFLAGIESFGFDIEIMNHLKQQIPSLKITALGYIPSISAKEVLEKNKVLDYIVMNEPEISFSEFYDALKEKKYPQGISGIAYRENSNIVITGPRKRIKDLDKLPFADHSLIKMNLYNEFLLNKPFTALQTSRGCPFECAFCIPMYGREIVYRSVENILAEIEELLSKYKIKTIRFIDDTFTLHKNRILELCRNILTRNLHFGWSCLSRVDTLDNQMLDLMNKAGCRRIYLGIETSSQRLLDFYKKGYKADLIKETVKMIKKHSIEVVGFFIVGGPQNNEEFKQDMSLTKEIKLDYIIVQKITSYIGTPLFGNYKYIALKNRDSERERVFYKNFYFRPKYMLKKLGNIFFNIKDIWAGIKGLVKISNGFDNL